MSTVRDRCRGVLIGLAAGDRIGGPLRMALYLAESLRDRGCFDPADLLARYLRWWREGAFDTGPVSDRVLALIAAGTPAAEAAAQVHRELGGKTAGCNPAHRSAPLSMMAAIGDEELAAAARAEAHVTHHHPLAGEVAAVVNRLCRSLIRGRSWPDAVRSIAGSAELEGPASSGGYAPDVLRAAIHFVGASASFDEALRRALSFAGPSNYCPVLAGSIGGARWGEAAVPRAALAHVDLLPEVRELAGALAASWPADE